MYDGLAIQPFRLPSEEVLTKIERDRKITIRRDAFVSKGFYNPNNQKGKEFPVFYSNDGHGKHVPLVEIDKSIYVVGDYGVKSSDPIYLSSMNEGRKIER